MVEINKQTITVKQKMFILKKQDKDEFVISKFKKWDNYKHMTLKELKESSYRFDPNSPYRNLMGVNYYLIFRGTLSISYLDVSENKMDTDNNKKYKKNKTSKLNNSNPAKSEVNKDINGDKYDKLRIPSLLTNVK